eukprot:scaffold4280_cov385-Prasinococcus_capsulatus_cf.AAC.6
MDGLSVAGCGPRGTDSKPALQARLRASSGDDRHPRRLGPGRIERRGVVRCPACARERWRVAGDGTELGVAPTRGVRCYNSARRLCDVSTVSPERTCRSSCCSTAAYVLGSITCNSEATT